MPVELYVLLDFHVADVVRPIDHCSDPRREYEHILTELNRLAQGVGRNTGVVGNERERRL
ncbi:hypothetical protein [Streptomyces sp. NPDC014805]|uniref:hypothetical protein n=1 Tax=Streptomyces sp. NPDC014805 TaxID=3364919 RepID=UPI0036FEE31A